MKKMNNKGFAISTLLYGLLMVAFLVVSLLMSLMATNRKNTSNLVRKIEEELNRYSETITEFKYTGDVQEYIVPYGKSGWYRIELWGASGQGVDSVLETSAGRGAYVSSIVWLPENQHIYFYVGGQGSSGTVYNGGSSGGGGATDVRTVGGAATDTTSKNSRFLIAAGGAKAAGGGTPGGYGTLGIKNYSDGGSFISGYAGVNGVNSSGTTLNSPNSFGRNEVGQIMMSGVNSGNGRARVEMVSNSSSSAPSNKRNPKLNGVRYIKDCITVSTATTNGGYEFWQEIQAIDVTGANLASSGSATYNGTSIANIINGRVEKISGSTTTSGTGEKCVIVDLGGSKTLEEIAIFHHFNSGTTITKETISVSSNGSSYTELRSWGSALGVYAPVESTYGVRISDRQVANMATVPTGNYYIVSANSDERVATAASEGTNTNVLLSLFTASKLQKWTIETVNGSSNTYKIIEADDGYALQPSDGTQEDGENVGVVDVYGNHTWEKWILRPQSNGYYVFQSAETRYGTFCMSTSSDSRNVSGPLVIRPCNYSNPSQQFKLVNGEF